MGRLQVLARGELRFRGGFGEFVPGASGKAIVAAIDAVAHRLPEFERDWALILDREIGNAAPRIELVRRGKGIRRTGVQAGPAGAAAVGLWRVGFTKFATRMLGDFVEHAFEPKVGDPVTVGQTIGWVEGFKALTDLYCVADGTFAELRTRADLAEAGSSLEEVFLRVTSHDDRMGQS